MHTVRGSGEQEKMLRNARTEYQEEAHEIATYTVIDSLATAVGDKQTAKLARDILRQEERMQQFLAGLLPEAVRGRRARRDPRLGDQRAGGPRDGWKRSGRESLRGLEDRRRPKQDVESKQPIVEPKQGQGMTVGRGAPRPAFRSS